MQLDIRYVLQVPPVQSGPVVPAVKLVRFVCSKAEVTGNSDLSLLSKNTGDEEGSWGAIRPARWRSGAVLNRSPECSQPVPSPLLNAPERP